jgi:hypothetical protein
MLVFNVNSVKREKIRVLQLSHSPGCCEVCPNHLREPCLERLQVTVLLWAWNSELGKKKRLLETET